MQDYKSVDISMTKGDKFSLNQCLKNNFEEKMEKIPYISVVGSLIYAQVCTHPDTEYIIGMLEIYLSNSRVDH